MKKIIKIILNKIFGVAYLHVLRRINYVIHKIRGGYFSINNLDQKLEKYVDFDNGFYVELGANDGVSQSNSLYFELKRGWRGVLVEPTPHNYLSCKENRSTDNFIFCNACVGFEYKEKYVDIKYANLMTVSQNLSLDLENFEEHVQIGAQFLGRNENVFEFGSVAKTLTSILEDSNSPNVIDFLSLDVEGAELDVLRGIDFGRYNFKYMLIEIRDFDRIDSFLKQFKYRFVEKFSSHDYLFKYFGEN